MGARLLLTMLRSASQRLRSQILRRYGFGGGAAAGAAAATAAATFGGRSLLMNCGSGGSGGGDSASDGNDPTRHAATTRAPFSGSAVAAPPAAAAAAGRVAAVVLQAAAGEHAGASRVWSHGLVFLPAGVRRFGLRWQHWGCNSGGCQRADLHATSSPEHCPLQRPGPGHLRSNHGILAPALTVHRACTESKYIEATTLYCTEESYR